MTRAEPRPPIARPTCAHCNRRRERPHGPRAGGRRGRARAAGRPSPACIQGFNMPHRLVLGDNIVHPGETFEVAVFAINGPISAAPANFLWFREAKVEFYR